MGLKFIILLFSTLLFFVVSLINGCSDVKLQGAIINPKTVAIRIKNYCPPVKQVTIPGSTTLTPAAFSFADLFTFNASSSNNSARICTEFG